MLNRLSHPYLLFKMNIKLNLFLIVYSLSRQPTLNLLFPLNPLIVIVFMESFLLDTGLKI